MTWAYILFTLTLMGASFLGGILIRDHFVHTDITMDAEITAAKDRSRWITAKLPVVRERINAQLRQSILQRDFFQCQECGMTGCCNLHVGHFIPVSAGGTNEPENLYTSCAKCNLRRGNKPFDPGLTITKVVKAV